MSELVKLIAAWEEYARENTTASAAEFCIYFLANKRDSQLAGELTTPELDTMFATLIGRLANMQTAYSKIALQDMPGFELEWFHFLSSIYHLKEAKKMQIVQYNFTEQTTGIDILNRLNKLGYIKERTDPADKRAKLISITDEGEKVLFQLYQMLHKPTLLMYSNIDHQDKQLMISFLKETEHRHQALLSNSKGKSIDDLLLEVLGEERFTQH